MREQSLKHKSKFCVSTSPIFAVPIAIIDGKITNFLGFIFCRYVCMLIISIIRSWQTRTYYFKHIRAASINYRKVMHFLFSYKCNFMRACLQSWWQAIFNYKEHSTYFRNSSMLTWLVIFAIKLYNVAL